MLMKPFPIREIFGYPPENRSSEAKEAKKNYYCPFLGRRCMKESRRLDYPFGACSVRQIKDDRVLIICPMRFYGNDQTIIDEVGHRLCGEAAHVAKIPEVRAGRFSIDWVVACCDASGVLVDYHGIEVVAVDTTGSLDQYFDAYMKGEDWQSIKQRYGINWANVYKRTLPQLIAKGALLASYGKKLGVIIQDRLVRSLQERLTIPTEPESSANMLFFAYKLAYVTADKKYDLILSEVIPILV
ncbi:TPA: hypothetical protein EYP75_00795, partial [Candidatus Bathyarchaeota archaeon]|nr:hypothetical protein [Candidatus Bathyarchaeota archaeon]